MLLTALPTIQRICVLAPREGLVTEVGSVGGSTGILSRNDGSSAETIDLRALRQDDGMWCVEARTDLGDLFLSMRLWDVLPTLARSLLQALLRSPFLSQL